MTRALSLEQKSTTMNTSPSNGLKNRNFRMLWIGEGISLLGDQFYLIAPTWLVLSLTGNALAVGTVMAGIPRALFMLVAAMIVLPALIIWGGVAVVPEFGDSEMLIVNCSSNKSRKENIP